MTEAGGSLAESIVGWYAVHARDLPWRRDGFTAWGTLVSEFMLQQTPAARVVEPLERWLRRWPSPADLATEPAGEAVRAWGSLGYPRRALWLHACAVAIAERHGGVVPSKVDELLALPGIGDYTARAVAVFGYGRRHPVVDTNIRRVIARAVGGQAEAGPPSSSRDLAAMDALLPVDVDESCVFNAGMMELGALVCTARNPDCTACPILECCQWQAAGRPGHIGPRRRPQKKYAGSDRQVRGVILAALRTSHEPVPVEQLESLWPDAAQRDRALAGLVADGLAVPAGGGYALPG